MASASASLSLAFSPLLLPIPRPRPYSRPINPGFPNPLRLSLARSPPSRRAGPVTAVPDGVAVADVVEKDWSFLDAASAGGGGSLPRALAAGALSPASRVLAVTPAPSFVDALLAGNPCELLVAAHESLHVLAGIKEGHDEVRCFHLEGGGGGRGGGVVEAVPERFDAFDAVFVCYFPGMGVSAAALLKSLAKRCSKGGRVVIFLDQGQQSLEQHRKEHPEVVTADLPTRPSLEKATAGSKFEIVEFVDEPTLYLAVLQFQG
uniref:Methyltransferase type 11 domain-containing protein n=1 Tax=Oryza punctata TaxID=4537 RepID=A0A0E0KAS8_ORYPU